MCVCVCVHLSFESLYNGRRYLNRHLFHQPAFLSHWHVWFFCCVFKNRSGIKYKQKNGAGIDAILNFRIDYYGKNHNFMVAYLDRLYKLRITYMRELFFHFFFLWLNMFICQIVSKMHFLQIIYGRLVFFLNRIKFSCKRQKVRWVLWSAKNLALNFLRSVKR